MVTTLRSQLVAVALFALAIGGYGPPAIAQDEEPFDPAAEILNAERALEFVALSRGGMGGLGVMPEADLQAINGLLSVSEQLLREAQRHYNEATTVHGRAWAAAYARAAAQLAEAALQLGRYLHHF